jgi:hypothetical protein
VYAEEQTVNGFAALFQFFASALMLAFRYNRTLVELGPPPTRLLSRLPEDREWELADLRENVWTTNSSDRFTSVSSYLNASYFDRVNDPWRRAPFGACLGSKMGCFFNQPSSCVVTLGPVRERQEGSRPVGPLLPGAVAWHSVPALDTEAEEWALHARLEWQRQGGTASGIPPPLVPPRPKLVRISSISPYRAVLQNLTAGDELAAPDWFKRDGAHWACDGCEAVYAEEVAERARMAATGQQPGGAGKDRTPLQMRRPLSLAFCRAYCPLKLIEPVRPPRLSPSITPPAISGYRKRRKMPLASPTPISISDGYDASIVMLQAPTPWPTLQPPPRPGSRVFLDRDLAWRRLWFPAFQSYLFRPRRELLHPRRFGVVVMPSTMRSILRRGRAAASTGLGALQLDLLAAAAALAQTNSKRTLLPSLSPTPLPSDSSIEPSLNPWEEPFQPAATAAEYGFTIAIHFRAGDASILQWRSHEAVSEYARYAAFIGRALAQAAATETQSLLPGHNGAPLVPKLRLVFASDSGKARAQIVPIANASGDSVQRDIHPVPTPAFVPRQKVWESLPLGSVMFDASRPALELMAPSIPSYSVMLNGTTYDSHAFCEVRVTKALVFQKFATPEGNQSISSTPTPDQDENAVADSFEYAGDVAPEDVDKLVDAAFHIESFIANLQEVTVSRSPPESWWIEQEARHPEVQRMTEAERRRWRKTKQAKWEGQTFKDVNDPHEGDGFTEAIVTDLMQTDRGQPDGWGRKGLRQYSLLSKVGIFASDRAFDAHLVKLSHSHMTPKDLDVAVVSCDALHGCEKDDIYLAALSHGYSEFSSLEAMSAKRDSMLDVFEITAGAVVDVWTLAHNSGFVGTCLSQISRVSAELSYAWGLALWHPIGMDAEYCHAFPIPHPYTLMSEWRSSTRTLP